MLNKPSTMWKAVVPQADTDCDWPALNCSECWWLAVTTEQETIAAGWKAVLYHWYKHQLLKLILKCIFQKRWVVETVTKNRIPPSYYFLNVLKMCLRILGCFIKYTRIQSALQSLGFRIVSSQSLGLRTASRDVRVQHRVGLVSVIFKHEAKLGGLSGG
jgi:hypothetical protein